MTREQCAFSVASKRCSKGGPLSFRAFAWAIAALLPAAPAWPQGPDGLDAAALAAMAAAPEARGSAVSRDTAWFASRGGAAAAVEFASATAILALGLPSLDLELGAATARWVGPHTQVYSAATAFVSPRLGFAAGARLTGGVALQASWTRTLVRLGAAASVGAAVGEDQGFVPLVPAELSVEVLQAARSRWVFARLTAGAETAASERWAWRGGLAIGAVL